MMIYLVTPDSFFPRESIKRTIVYILVSLDSPLRAEYNAVIFVNYQMALVVCIDIAFWE